MLILPRARTPEASASHVHVLSPDSLCCPPPANSYLVEELAPARGAAPPDCGWQVEGLCLSGFVAAFADIGQGCQAPLVPPVLCRKGRREQSPLLQLRASSTLLSCPEEAELGLRALCPTLHSSSLAAEP